MDLKVMKLSMPQPSEVASLKNNNFVSKMRGKLQLPFKTFEQGERYNWQVLFPVCFGPDGLKKHCGGFTPMPTDKGLCYTISGGTMESLYKRTEFMDVMMDVFSSSETRTSNASKESEKQKLLAFREIYMYTGNSRKPALSNFQISSSSSVIPNFLVSFNSGKNPFNVRTRSLTVKPGYKTIIKLVPRLTTSSGAIQPLTPTSRKCRFASESENMEVLRHYSQAGCEFECALRHSREICGCVPWNYPHPQEMSLRYVIMLEIHALMQGC